MRILGKTAAAAGFAAMILLGCSTKDATTTTANDDYGRVEPATTAEGTVTPAVIPGPAKVDSSGNVYTSSAAPGTGNASNIGTNTNVNIVPEKAQSSTTVTYTEATPPAAPVVETTTVVETPAATVVQTEVTTPVVETPMVRSTQEETTRVRMSKD